MVQPGPARAASLPSAVFGYRKRACSLGQVHCTLPIQIVLYTRLTPPSGPAMACLAAAAIPHHGNEVRWDD